MIGSKWGSLLSGSSSSSSPFSSSAALTGWVVPPYNTNKCNGYVCTTQFNHYGNYYPENGLTGSAPRELRRFIKAGR